jgi:hypothetical protein
MALWLLFGLLPALLGFRFLYGDGAFYLLQILEHRAFFLPTDVRQSAQILTQWPALGAIELGCTDLRLLARCLGAGMMLVPVLLHAVAILILLRRGRSLQAVVYLIMLWLLTLFSSLMVTSESHVAVAVFLLAVVVALGESRFGFWSWTSLLAIALISFRLYEFWFFYAGALAALLGWRLKARLASMHRLERCLGGSLLLILLASMAYNASNLMAPGPHEDRGSLLQMLWGTTLPVYVAVISAWFAGLCAHAWLHACPPEARIVRLLPSARTRWLALLIALAAIMAVALSGIQHNTMIRYSYPFRTLNLVLPMVYLVWLVCSNAPTRTSRALPGIRTLLAALTVSLLVQEIQMTSGWRNYQRWVGAVPPRQAGAVHAAMPPAGTLAAVWTYPWTQSSQSFLAQALRSGAVNGISYDPGAVWDPYGPTQEQRLESLARAHGVRWE